MASTDVEYIPQISVGFADVNVPKIIFKGEGINLSEDIVNQTGQQRESPHSYMPISISQIRNRIEAEGGVEAIDHLGVNFPWFNGLSPHIARLRQKLPRHCAYYRFPTGEEWDFILPATEREITQDDIDLTKERRPKFELVSFEKSSRPIIQIDCITTIYHEKLKQLFPEGLADDELKNIWVYLENPTSLIFV